MSPKRKTVPGLRVAWLGNHGLKIRRLYHRGEILRFVPQDGSVMVDEAAAALKTYKVRVYRLIARGQVKAVKLDGKAMIPVTELWRLRRDQSWRDDFRRLEAARGR